MRERSVPEAVDVVFDGVWVDAALFGPLLQNFGVVDSLRATKNLFASHEEVV
jgi:hypothetical protein